MYTYSRSRQTRGFTLVEVLIAITLFAVASSGLYFSLRTGMLMYERAQGGLKTNHAITQFYNTMTAELRNALLYSPIPFQGTRTTLVFPSVIQKYTKKGVSQEIATIEYAGKGKKLVRKETILSGKRKQEEKRNMLAAYLDDFSLQYGVYDRDGERIVWQDRWEKDTAILPQVICVAVRVRYRDAETEKVTLKRFEKKIVIPHGVLSNEEV